jgi:diguanylate cyclase (GGDEF)-like protein
VLPDADAAGAWGIGQRILQAVAALGIEHARGDRPHVSVSVGVATADAAPGPDVDALLARADAALYAAKHRGRGQVVADGS